MDDILTSIIGIGIAAVLMFIFPLITMSDRTDDISQLTVEIATTEFVDDIRQSGKITPDRYSQFIQNLGSTGNTYNVQIEVRILDENPNRKLLENSSSTTTSGTNNQNVYYSVYNSQIEDTLEDDKAYYLKEGDLITVNVNNTNQTISQQLKNFFYRVVGEDTYTIASSHGGMIAATGR